MMSAQRVQRRERPTAAQVAAEVRSVLADLTIWVPQREHDRAEFQQLEIGQWVPMSPTPSDTTAFRVTGFEPNRWLLWHQPLSTWSWRLTPLPGDRTRLVTRLRIHLDWRHPAISLFSVVLNEFGDFGDDASDVARHPRSR